MCVGYCNLSLGRMEDARVALDEAIARSGGRRFRFLARALDVHQGDAALFDW